MKNRIEVGKTYKNINGQTVEIIYKRNTLISFCYIGIKNGSVLQTFKESGESFTGEHIFFEAEYKLRDIVILKNGLKVEIVSIHEDGKYSCTSVEDISVFYSENLDVSEIVRKATKEEAECPYQDGELCLVKLCNRWHLRFSNGAGEFYTDQNIGGITLPYEEHQSAYPLTDLPESEL